MKRNFQKSFDNYLCLQRLSEKTKEAYLHSVTDVSSFHQQSAEQLTNDQVQDYLLYCIQERKLACPCQALSEFTEKMIH
jgi:hypothetical protein